MASKIAGESSGRFIVVVASVTLLGVGAWGIWSALQPEPSSDLEPVAVVPGPAAPISAEPAEEATPENPEDLEVKPPAEEDVVQAAVDPAPAADAGAEVDINIEDLPVRMRASVGKPSPFLRSGIDQHPEEFPGGGKEPTPEPKGSGE